MAAPFLLYTNDSLDLEGDPKGPLMESKRGERRRGEERDGVNTFSFTNHSPPSLVPLSPRMRQPDYPEREFLPVPKNKKERRKSPENRKSGLAEGVTLTSALEHSPKFLSSSQYMFFRSRKVEKSPELFYDGPTVARSSTWEPEDPLLLQAEIQELKWLSSQLQQQVDQVSEKEREQITKQLLAFNEKGNKKRMELVGALRSLRVKVSQAPVLFSPSVADELVQSLLNLEIAPHSSVKSTLLHLTGPNDNEIPVSHTNIICGHTVSTYPVLGGKRAGSPICDRFNAYLMDNAAVVVVADGCNWGERPRDAAAISSSALNKYLRVNLERFGSIHQISKGILKAFALAQNEILLSKEEPLESGTTTLIGGVIVPLKKEDTALLEPNGKRENVSPKKEEAVESGRRKKERKKKREKDKEEREKDKSKIKESKERKGLKEKRDTKEKKGRDPKRERRKERTENEKQEKRKSQPPRPKSHEDHATQLTDEPDLFFAAPNPNFSSSFGPSVSRIPNSPSDSIISSIITTPLTTSDSYTSLSISASSSTSALIIPPKKTSLSHSSKNIRFPPGLRSPPSHPISPPLRPCLSPSLSPKKSEPRTVTYQDWAIVLGTVGDCKAFLWNPRDKIVTEITKGNRQNPRDARDCGGRLGPAIGEGKPDLRNFCLKSVVCREGDFLLLMSDGVHDNFDPEHLGFLPSDLPAQMESFYPEVDNRPRQWDDVGEHIRDIKDNFRESLLQKMLCDLYQQQSSIFNPQTPPKSPSESDKSGPDESTGPTPTQIVNYLLHYCNKTTAKARGQMENSDGQLLPHDYTLYPGKMDHSTCLCVRICDFSDAGRG